MVVGSVAATWVSVKTSFHLVNSAGKEFLNLQNQLDGVYPGFLTAAFVIFCWWLMSKKKVISSCYNVNLSSCSIYRSYDRIL